MTPTDTVLDVVSDVRRAARTLAKSPTFAVASVLILVWDYFLGSVLP